MSEIEKNFKKKFGQSTTESENLVHRLEKICDGLVYISEEDSPVTVFTGHTAGETEPAGLLEQICPEPGEPVKEVDFGSFFDRLTAVKDWHGEREHVRTKKFLDLQKLIEENLISPKVFKIGTIHVRIVVAGLDAGGRAVGVTTWALET